MSENHLRTAEEKRIDRRSFIIGIFIAAAIMGLFVVLYYAGLLH